MKERLKKIRCMNRNQERRNITGEFVTGGKIFLYSFLLLLFVCSLLAERQLLDIADNWQLETAFSRDGSSYKRISVFFSPKSQMERSGIMQLRNKLSEQLFNSPSLEAGEKESIFIDAYEGREQMEVSYQNNFQQADGYFVGGHYFEFHSMSFLNGNQFSEEDFLQDKAVISESLSFALFGSADSAGKTIWVNEKGIVVCGVIKEKEGRISRLANSNTKKIYLPYDLAEQLDCNVFLTSYEILLPEPLEGFAAKTMEEALSVNRYNRQASMEEKEICMIEETNRFHVKSLLKTATRLHERTMKKIPVVFPDWENERIIVENQLILIYIIRAIMSLFTCLWKNSKKKIIFTAKEIKIL